jgi:polyribonucleotide 5'-hydroxyl-kinase
MDLSNDNTNVISLPDPIGERHTLQAHEELRIEIAYGTHAVKFILQQGSCELWGCELAVGKLYEIANGGLQLALFTWHGCVLDVEGSASIDISYVSPETDSNISFVNTHAQLEALRDEALKAGGQGPRVLVVGPPESGKSSLVKTLVAYACKVGRTPLFVDLDPSDNFISVPGTLAVAPMTASAFTVETYATCGLPPNTAQPLVVWHGSTTVNPDLFPAQVERLAASIESRFDHDDQARASGLIVNTNGWIQDGGYPLLLQTADALKITVILIMGHDRLYSLMSKHYKDQPDIVETPKVLKLPRSGGVVSRTETLKRHLRARAVKRYLYGDLVDGPGNTDSTTSTSPAIPKVPELTPFALTIRTSEIQVFQLSSMTLSSSLLPVAQQQSTDTIQMEAAVVNEALQHKVLAVCHPHAVQAYQQSGQARHLWTAGVAGFCTVERLDAATDTLHLLSPCAGALPSKTLLLGDVTWME